MDELRSYFPSAVPGDLVLTFREADTDKLPLERAAIKTDSGFEDLYASMTELGSGILLAVRSDRSGRCFDSDGIFRPLIQRDEELEDYRNRSCFFRRNGDPNSNFFTVETAGDGTVWVLNKGKRALGFQMPDGQLYRVCAGYTEALTPSNTQAQLAPIQVLLDLGNNLLEFQISAVHVRYGESPWQRGGVDCESGTLVDSYFCRVFCGDDCLGVLESHGQFLGQPQLELLDIESYGPSQWFARNKGKASLPLAWPDGRTADVPADGAVYRLETLGANKEGKAV